MSGWFLQGNGQAKRKPLPLVSNLIEEEIWENYAQKIIQAQYVFLKRPKMGG